MCHPLKIKLLLTYFVTILHVLKFCSSDSHPCLYPESFAGMMTVILDTVGLPQGLKLNFFQRLPSGDLRQVFGCHASTVFLHL